MYIFDLRFDSSFYYAFIKLLTYSSLILGAFLHILGDIVIMVSKQNNESLSLSYYLSSSEPIRDRIDRFSKLLGISKSIDLQIGANILGLTTREFRSFLQDNRNSIGNFEIKEKKVTFKTNDITSFLDNLRNQFQSWGAMEKKKEF